MKKTYLKFIRRSNLSTQILSATLFLISGCAFLGLSDEVLLVNKTSTNFLKAEAFVLNEEYEKAIPFLDLTLKQNDSDYNTTLLLSARAYDQIGQPEKVILAANELLEKKIDAATELKIRSLFLKNLAKVGTDISDHLQKKLILNLTQKTSTVENVQNDGIYILESLKWSLDFSCDQFCVSEIYFLKEIQLQYLHIIEKDAVASEHAAETIKNTYEFFQSFLSKEHLNISFRKKIAVAILDSLNKLSSLQLAMPNQGSIRAAAAIQKLAPIEKNIESWLHQ